jgi:hypothetical protein
MEVDPAYETVEAHGGKATPSRLLIVRRAGAGSRAVDGGEQLTFSGDLPHAA